MSWYLVLTISGEFPVLATEIWHQLGTFRPREAWRYWQLERHHARYVFGCTRGFPRWITGRWPQHGLLTLKNQKYKLFVEMNQCRGIAVLWLCRSSHNLNYHHILKHWRVRHIVWQGLEGAGWLFLKWQNKSPSDIIVAGNLPACFSRTQAASPPHWSINRYIFNNNLKQCTSIFDPCDTCIRFENADVVTDNTLPIAQKVERYNFWHC